MSCGCGSAAVLETPIAGDAAGRLLYVCSSCGRRWSDARCEIRGCRSWGEVACRGTCGRLLCSAHARGTGLLNACARCSRERAERRDHGRRRVSGDVPYWAR